MSRTFTESAAFQDTSGQATSRVKEDDATCKAVSIAGTPAFLIGILQEDGRVKVTQRLMGALPLSKFEEVLDPLTAGMQAVVQR